MTSHSIDTILWQSLAVLLLIGALLGILLGSLLILRPQLVQPVNRAANRWISMRHLNLLFDRSISIEHLFYRHHRLAGMVSVLGAAYILVSFGLLFDKAAAVQRLAYLAPPRLLEGLLDALALGALTGAAVALVAGLFLWLRPGMLRDTEAWTNRWVSSRRSTKVLDVPRDQVERFVMRHAPRLGWLLLLGSLYLFFVLASWLAM